MNDGEQMNIRKRKRLVWFVGVYNLITILTAGAFYPLIPIILNYPPKFNQLSQITGITYNQSYLFITFISVVFGTALLIKFLGDIDNWDLKNDQSDLTSQKIRQIREKCLNYPYAIYIIQILAPMFLIVIFHLILSMTIGSSLLMIKNIIVFFSFGTLIALFSQIFARKSFRDILLHNYSGKPDTGLRISLLNKFYFQFIPVFIVVILFTSLIGYSKLVKEKGDLLSFVYHKQLADMFHSKDRIKDIEEIRHLLRDISLDGKDCVYIETPEGRIITSTHKSLDRFFIGYLSISKLQSSGRIYGMTEETQGVFIRKKDIHRGVWTIGIKFNVASSETVFFFISTFVILLLLNIIALTYFSKTLIDDISLVSRSLLRIAKGSNIDLNEKLAVTSNDEIGDLVIAFNKIQELEKENIQKIKENQAILIERERLASLGHLIGGIAHNMKTPIMSISGGTEALKDLIKEYLESVDDSNVTIEDHIEISQEMQKWVESIRTHCAYMSEIISAVREQAVQMNYSESLSFTVDDLVKRITTLMKFELKKNNCKLNPEIRVPGETEILGEETNLVQVLNNLVVNAIQSYEQQGGNIDLIVEQSTHELEFIVRDYGKGIPLSIQNILFKEMVTTKGKQGTGLGLYMSYITIKGKFGGNMWFESAEGKGTSFHITIPF